MALTVLGVAQVISTSAYLLVRGTPAAVEGSALLVGNLYPFACAWWAQRPGGYLAGTRTALAFAVAVTVTLALTTGGLSSPFMPILITIPSADYSASGPRGVLALGCVAVVAALAVALVDTFGWVDHAALPAEVVLPSAAIFLVHCVLVMVAVNLGLARARARATRELAAARDAALSASHAKSAFLAMMSHELRTPLTGISGMLDILVASASERETLRRLEVARTSTRALRTILDDVLDLSKIEAGRLELNLSPGRPADIVRAVADLFAVTARERGIDLRVDIDPRCEGMGMLDAARLRQVVSNLVGNAIKFTDSGQVSVKARVEPGKPGRLLIAVKDSGIGIPANRIPELFRPFVQVHEATRAAGGTGLGLAITRSLVEKMGGTVAVSSAVGVGSTLTVDVPLPGFEADPRSIASPQPLVAAPGSEVPLRILVAEDSPIVRSVIEGLLELLGHRAQFAENGMQAVECAKSGLFDLILMDMKMPVLDGLVATRMIRGLPPPHGRARIIGLSADAFAENRDHALAVGCDDYLLKPIDLDALRDALATAMRAREQRRGDA